MEIQDPSTPQPVYYLAHNDYSGNNLNPISSPYASHNPSPTTPTAPQIPSLFGNSESSNTAPSSVFKGLCHRRAHSDGNLQIAADDDVGISGEPFNCSSTSTLSETGSEDDLVSVFLDLQKLGGNEDHGAAAYFMDHDDGGRGGDGCSGGGESKKSVRFRHRYSSSVEGLGDVNEVNKAMPSDKLAEICALDLKRVKRILANRQSAARSKERKARYVLELEQKAQSLRSEAMNLSAQLTLYQRDATGLTTENAELKIRLQAMEQHAQLRDALNEALKQEFERLKIVTGEIKTLTESSSLRVRHVLHSPSTLQPVQYSSLTSPSTLQTISYSQADSPSPRTTTSPFPLLKRSVPELSQLPPLHNSWSSLSRRRFNPGNPQTPPEQDSLGSLRGIDIWN